MTKQEKIDVRIFMDSDWHIGSGTGRPGNVDRLVQRDSDGLPKAPAKTVNGIWRDACEMLAYGLDGGHSTGPWHDWVDFLFGDQPALAQSAKVTPPRPAAVAVEPARTPGPLRRALLSLDNDKDREVVRRAFTFVKPGIGIDKNSGRSKTDFLRFEEMARIDSVLETTLTLTLPDDAVQKETARNLLFAASKLVNRIGGKRRRGSGSCRVVLPGREKEVQAALEWLNSHETPPASPPKPNEENGNETGQHVSAALTGDWVAIPLSLRLQTPLAVFSQKVGNVVESLDYLPGTYLLPHVSKVLRKLGITPQSLFAAGTLQVLPATIEVNGDRGLPVPMILQKTKGSKEFEDPKSVINDRENDLSEQDKKQRKQLRHGYISETPVDNNDEPRKIYPAFKSVRRTLQTHNVVDDKVQRPTEEEVGGVFSYQAIAVEDKDDNPTVLRTELRLPKTIHEEWKKKNAGWHHDLAGDCRLGRSRKDDYGLVTIEVGSVKDLDRSAKSCRQNRLVVWLVSDVLLRGDGLRPDATVTALQKELEQRLGALTLDEVFAYTRTRRIESWNRNWCLPRSSLVSLQAGSCCVFLVASTIDTKLLTELEITGIGERRGEGYGQLRFNDPAVTSKMDDWQPMSTKKENNHDIVPPEEFKIPDGDYHAYARAIEKSLWLDEIQLRAAIAMGNPMSRKKHLDWEISGAKRKPPMTQLGALRSVLQHLQKRGDEDRALEWLKHLRDNENRRDKWPKESLKRIEHLLIQSEEIWKILARPEYEEATFSPPVLTHDGRTVLTEQLWAYAVRALIDAAVRAHKRDLEKNSNGSKN